MNGMGRSQLTPELLLAAYSQGIFPMGVDGQIQWFSPDPRAIIPLETFHVPRTLLQRWRQGVFEIRVNTAFADRAKEARREHFRLRPLHIHQARH